MRVAPLFVAMHLFALASASMLLTDDFSSYQEGSTASPPWQLAWQGYAHYAVENNAYKLWTDVPTGEEGHSALAIRGNQNWGDYVFEVDVKTQAHQRIIAPKPWDVAWVFFRYNGQYNWYYFVLKTNGYELGKNPGCLNCQAFLVTGSTRRLEFGKWYHVKIELNNSHITVFLNGEKIVDYVDPQPYLNGSIALYEENSIAYFDNVKVYMLAEPPQPPTSSAPTLPSAPSFPQLPIIAINQSIYAGSVAGMPAEIGGISDASHAQPISKYVPPQQFITTTLAPVYYRRSTAFLGAFPNVFKPELQTEPWRGFTLYALYNASTAQQSTEDFAIAALALAIIILFLARLKPKG